jgi:alpha-tubulin suppressor-like RCC1 family protein
MFACGHNDYGQLGLGDTTNRNTFTAVPALPDGKVAMKVVAGGYHTMILAEDGTVFVCGWNNVGQLGLGDTTNRRLFPIKKK